ncbi:NADH-quinone oxidoreductase subunit N [Planctomyces sp. SH-PL62]|uniref:NADH-quinone oxidoreductase subunit N n=1 Tax=Planctomyces sp. SH-PL62 TaxID=1636152 RepID=UPI00078B2A41|nr:NADH-quinone oxidoreductase subunit N [Planctomyces sp. SH-PL62]AMV39566.1 NADH-quinone oxidoreductase subunit N [Planctomyces sp. SH-PL62]
MTLQLAYRTVQETLLVLSPEILLLAVAIVMMTAAPFVRVPRRGWCGLSAVGLVASLLALLASRDVHPDVYIGAALNDALSFYVRLFVILTGLVLLGLAHREPPDDRAAEFFGSFLMIQAGTMLVAASNDMILLFVGLELVSIPTYLLLYLSRRTASTQEAVTKYFFLSIFSSALLLYGLTFLYGLAGTTNLKALSVLTALPYVPQLSLGLLAVLFLMAGLCFRVAAVPLHFYAPDVYQASPVVIAALLSWVPKVVGFVAMIRALTSVLAFKGLDDPLVHKTVLLCWIIAVATMTLGNSVALLQADLKRLFAYSSIAHAGYLMVGVTAAFAGGSHGSSFYFGVEAVLFYLAAYAFMTLGAFGVILALRKPDGRPVTTIGDLSGLGWSQPIVALGMTLCLLSLSGIPPLVGFFGKLQIFASVFSAASGDEAWSLQLLAIIGVLNAAVGAFYYLRIIVLMYFKTPSESVQAVGGWPVALATGACASLCLVSGIYSTPISRACRAAAVAANVRPIPENHDAPAVVVGARTEASPTGAARD